MGTITIVKSTVFITTRVEDVSHVNMKRKTILHTPLCLHCGVRPAQQKSPYGFLPCLRCQKRHQKLKKPRETIEITTEEIRESRKKYREDTIQPFRADKLSKNYIKKYGTKNLQVTKAQVKEALNKPDVWGHTDYND